MADEEQVVDEVQEFNENANVPEIDVFAGMEDADGEAEPAAGEEAQEGEEAQPEGEEEGQEAEGEPAEEQAQVDEGTALQRSMDDIMRRDMQLRQRESALKENEQTARQAQELLKLMQSDPLEAIRRAGGDMSKVMEKMIGPDPELEQMEKNPVIKRLMGQIDELKKDLTQKEQQQKQASHYQTQQQIYGEYGKYAQNNAEQFPVLSAFADKIGPDTMFNLAAQYTQQTGHLPDVTDLAKHSEQMLLAQGKEMLGRLAKLDAFKEYFSGNGESQKENQAQMSSTPRETKTLQNKHMGKSPGKAKPPDLTDADPEEVIAAGMAAAASLFDD